MTQFHNYGEKFALILSSAHPKTGKTCQEIADSIGVSRTLISKWETQVQLPKKEIINVVAFFYQIEESLLTHALNLAIEERDSLVEARRSVKKKNKPPKIGTFSGEIGEIHMRNYLNLGLNIRDNL